MLLLLRRCYFLKYKVGSIHLTFISSAEVYLKICKCVHLSFCPKWPFSLFLTNRISQMKWANLLTLPPHAYIRQGISSVADFQCCHKAGLPFHVCAKITGCGLMAVIWSLVCVCLGLWLKSVTQNMEVTVIQSQVCIQFDGHACVQDPNCWFNIGVRNSQRFHCSTFSNQTLGICVGYRSYLGR